MTLILAFLWLLLPICFQLMTVIKMDCTFCEFDFKFWTDVKIFLFTIEISHYRGLRPTFPHTDFSVFFKFLSSQSFVKSRQLWDLINIISLTYLDLWSNESSQQNLAEKPANFSSCWLLYSTLTVILLWLVSVSVSVGRILNKSE